MHRWVREEQILTTQKNYVTVVQLLLPSAQCQLWARQVHLVRSCSQAVASAVGLPLASKQSLLAIPCHGCSHCQAIFVQIL